MYKYLVLVHYDESEWEDDLVEIELPVDVPVNDYELIQEIKSCREQLRLEDFDTPQDLADMALSMAVSRWNGVWGYKSVAGVFEISDLDDPDPIEYEEEDE